MLIIIVLLLAIIAFALIAMTFSTKDNGRSLFVMIIISPIILLAAVLALIFVTAPSYWLVYEFFEV